MRLNRKFQRGFTLVEMIMVIVITGILGGMVALFLRWPVQGYVDSARRAELNDIAGIAMSRITRDIRTAAPSSVSITSAGAVLQLGPLSYVCAPVIGGGASGTLTRVSGVNPPLLATNVSACNFTNPVPRLVAMQLTLTESGESISLYVAAHVANTP